MNTSVATDTQWTAVTQAIAEICVRLPVSVGVAGLCKELSQASPHLAFREVLARGGWYRLGGVVDATGVHVADDIEKWAEQELAAHGDDLAALADDYADTALRATRLNGKTHYLVAAMGNGAADFLQVEVEELQETMCPFLFGSDATPGSLDELLDPPRDDCRKLPTPLGQPFFALRRVTDVADFLARMRAQKPDPQPVHRFVEAWEASSAGHATQLSNHWVMAVREHLDRYRQPILNAVPVAAVNGMPPRFEGAFGARGLALNEALQRFDRQAGYPMAWFFHMLTTKTVPHAVANAVVDDVQGGFSYLPERDVKVLKDWLHRPYGF